MNQYAMQAATSFLLGLTIGGLRSIIDSEEDWNKREKMLQELESQLRKEINRIYYSGVGLE